MTYSHRLGPNAELFAKADVVNVFDQHALVNPFFLERTVFTRSNSRAYQPFNPFTEQPVQGVHWDLGPNFVTPVSQFAYQSPRQYRFTAGIRF